MPRKTIIIFITVFILVGAIILGFYSWINKKDTTTTEDTTPWYQDFNPFGMSSDTKDTTTTKDGATEEEQAQIEEEGATSKFTQITDFAIAGATFLEDTRPIVKTEDEPKQEPIKIIIDANTKEGRKEIQTILNETLSLKPALVVDGIFGKKATEAIKAFQKLNNLTITGTIDENTAPYFTKNTDGSTTKEENLFEQAPSIRFVEKANGHIYKMFLDTKIKEKVSNSTIPTIYEAFFNNKANTVIYRYLSTNNIVSSFIATLGAPKGDFLPQNISDLSVSLDKTKFFYITENDNGSTGTVATFGDDKKDTFFNSPFTEWLSQWDNNGRIFLTTKPSYSVTGSIFLLNETNKTMTKVLGGIEGLTTLVNPKGTFILYSATTQTGPKLSVFDIAKHSTKNLEIHGLPEKCIWSIDNINIYCAIPSTVTGNNYPDSWYQGLVSFNDYFVRINTETGNKVTIANSIEETAVDATHLFLNKTEDLLFFTNKKDSTLWSLDIK